MLCRSNTFSGCYRPDIAQWPWIQCFLAALERAWMASMKIHHFHSNLPIIFPWKSGGSTPCENVCWKVDRKWLESKHYHRANNQNIPEKKKMSLSFPSYITCVKFQHVQTNSHVTKAEHDRLKKWMCECKQIWIYLEQQSNPIVWTQLTC